MYPKSASNLSRTLAMGNFHALEKRASPPRLPGKGVLVQRQEVAISVHLLLLLFCHNRLNWMRPLSKTWGWFLRMSTYHPKEKGCFFNHNINTTKCPKCSSTCVLRNTRQGSSLVVVGMDVLPYFLYTLSQ